MKYYTRSNLCQNSVSLCLLDSCLCLLRLLMSVFQCRELEEKVNKELADKKEDEAKSEEPEKVDEKEEKKEEKPKIGQAKSKEQRTIPVSVVYKYNRLHLLIIHTLVRLASDSDICASEI